MKYKKDLKKRIKDVYPKIKIGKIKLHGDSFRIVVKNPGVNLRELEQELREVFSMPGLCLVESGE
jgi:hypothetical protein|tara:strand:+ start:306 stop:500 length:195 start_codon:yes stop_codon:yes gene_type:complete